MNRIVRETHPVADLPEDPREGLALDDIVRVAVEPDSKVIRAPEDGFSLRDLYALATPSFRNRSEIVDHIAALRTEWDGQ